MANNNELNTVELNEVTTPETNSMAPSGGQVAMAFGIGFGSCAAIGGLIQLGVWAFGKIKSKLIKKQEANQPKVVSSVDEFDQNDYSEFDEEK